MIREDLFALRMLELVYYRVQMSFEKLVVQRYFLVREEVSIYYRGIYQIKEFRLYLRKACHGWLDSPWSLHISYWLLRKTK
ncbi:TPA: hypothetical protein DIC40_01170 [Patescibacteria group bacterium]|nr:hypothetical protein [Candidatus Gracilibacteria bacterium]